MNNETNKQVETFEDNFFDWLLGPNSKEISNVGQNQNKIENGKKEVRVQELEWEELDPLDSEEIDYPYDYESQPLTPGEVPTVYNRFETVLQKRLKAKIEAKPPRFPWENNLVNYDAEYPDVEVNNWFSHINLWASQMKNIKWGKLNIPLTETVFAQLLQSCQDLVSSDLLPGSKLVRAVDSLFPNQSQSLNKLAGLVLVGGTRDGELISNHITAYNTATPKQQMLLSLLAAQEIISSLSLTCCLNQSVTKREWQTALGCLTIEAEYYIPEDRSSACLRIKGELPGAGSFQVQGRGVEATAERSDAGTLCVELFDPQPDETYQLIIKFLNWEQSLKFVVHLQEGTGNRQQSRL
ncbi:MULTISPECIES: hypothetical protein [Okeania]|uniref:PatU n=1 Tax=Okeania hirsuta TaxID=1458930 RepID=A0A3N6P180_9CYAN|nr:MULTISPECIES: hypothetical protein [Okeania]NES91391.1 hypothetical protein [Okeania sp. SIO2B9]NET79748.1 hypothetical protein [Okeania sp. SIO1F9]RQH11880.1 hypothetical protein D4Z78_26430 [Okeania hirsuta]RQH25760.1 hypothetical protein D5R40_29175 [Okeania hirsuta]